MGRDDINAWFIREVWRRDVAIEGLSDEDLLSLAFEIHNVSNAIANLDKAETGWTVDTWVGRTGLAAGVGGVATLFTPFAEFAAPIALAGLAAVVFQFIRDGIKAANADWSAARQSELGRMHAQVLRLLRNRLHPRGSR